MTAALTMLFGAYQLWVVATGDLAGGWFGVLASQRDLIYVAGLVLPLSAFVGALSCDTDRAPSGGLALRSGLVVGGTVLLLTMGVAPMFETLVMRTALFDAVLSDRRGVVATPEYSAQGWWYWWGVYAAGHERVAEMLGLSLTEARPFWRTAGLLAWQPLYAGAAAVFTTLLGVSLGGRHRTRIRWQDWRLFAAVVVVQTILLAGWKCSRVLAIRFDVPPEAALGLFVLGPALLTCGVFLQGALRPAPAAPDA